MRVLYRFGKKDRLRFVSHLDLQRYMQRSFNRTKLPIAFTQGFNPHPVMNFASALAMGWTSNCEIMDVKLAKEIDLPFALTELRNALPEGLPVLEARFVEDSHPSTASLLKYAEYSIILSGETAETVIQTIPKYMEASEVLAIRKTKTSEKEINIRPLSVFVESKQTEVSCRLSLTETETLKPDLLIDTIARMAGVETPEVHIHRTALLTENGTDLFEA